MHEINCEESKVSDTAFGCLTPWIDTSPLKTGV